MFWNCCLLNCLCFVLLHMVCFWVLYLFVFCCLCCKVGRWFFYVDSKFSQWFLLPFQVALCFPPSHSLMKLCHFVVFLVLHVSANFKLINFYFFVYILTFFLGSFHYLYFVTKLKRLMSFCVAIYFCYYCNVAKYNEFIFFLLQKWRV